MKRLASILINSLQVTLRKDGAGNEAKGVSEKKKCCGLLQYTHELCMIRLENVPDLTAAHADTQSIGFCTGQVQIGFDHRHLPLLPKSGVTPQRECRGTEMLGSTSKHKIIICSKMVLCGPARAGTSTVASCPAGVSSYNRELRRYSADLRFPRFLIATNLSVLCN